MNARIVLRIPLSMAERSIARSVLRAAVQSLTVLGVLALAPESVAGAAQPAEVPSALVISKSSNHNQVHYAVIVDDACAPSGQSPVHPYWRMLERGPAVTEQLSGMEERALGVGRQDVEADSVRMVLRAFPSRPITIRTWRAADGSCTSAANMTIAGKPAHIASVFVQQSFLGVSYVLVTGRSADGSSLQERITN